jgi:hypothetical protein
MDRRGTGLSWENYEREGFILESGQKVKTTRRRVKVDEELPLGEAYGATIDGLLVGADAPARTARRRGRRKP